MYFLSTINTWIKYIINYQDLKLFFILSILIHLRCLCEEQLVSVVYKTIVHTNTLKHLMSGEDCRVKLATCKTGFGNMHFCICVCNLQRESWQTNWLRLNLALCNHITIYLCDYLTYPGAFFLLDYFEIRALLCFCGLI